MEGARPRAELVQVVLSLIDGSDYARRMARAGAEIYVDCGMLDAVVSMASSSGLVDREVAEWLGHNIKRLLGCR